MFHGVHFLDYLLTDEEVCSFEVHRTVSRNISSIVKPTRCTNVSNLFYFWNDILHVSDGLSVHHQEFKTVHTATGICETHTAVFLLADTAVCYIGASSWFYYRNKFAVISLET